MSTKSRFIDTSGRYVGGVDISEGTDFGSNTSEKFGPRLLEPADRPI